MRKYLLCITFFLACAILSNAQILFTESFTVILDTTKHIKGSFLPSFKYQNLKEDLVDISNQADLSLLIKDNAITFANQVSVSRFGGETLLSGGYVYGEFRRIYEKVFTLESYAQLHWAEARGMDRKYAGGINARWRVAKKSNMGIFFGIGPFYEFERWNFNGVANVQLIPPNEKFREQESLKVGSYFSLKYNPVASFSLDVSLYHQARLKDLIRSPRLASSTRITYNITKFLGLALTYQNIHDPRPLVPIDKLYQKIDLGLMVSF